MAEEQQDEQSFRLRTERRGDTAPAPDERPEPPAGPVDPDEMLRQTALGWEGGPPVARDGNEAPPRILPPAPPGGPPPSGGLGGGLTHGSDPTGRFMSYAEHLGELRDRLIKSMVGLIVGIAVSFLFTWNIVEVLKHPAGDVHFIYTEPTEPIALYMQVAFFSGIVLSTPIWLYQLIMFVAPGLTKNERRFVLTAVPAVISCFVLGMAFAYFVMFPPMLNFLYHFGSDQAENLVRLGRHISFVATLLFWIGLIFETPIVIYVLARLGIVSPARLTRIRPYGYVGAFILAAIITPTPDPLNQSIVAIPIILLFELGILLSRVAVKARGE